MSGWKSSGKGNKRDDVLVLRNIVGGVGVEFGFHRLSPNINDVKVVSRRLKRGGRVQRREPRIHQPASYETVRRSLRNRVWEL